MLTKKFTPSAYRKWFFTASKVLLLAETLAFGACYGVYHRLNTNRDFRFYMRNNYNWVLEGYYSIGEKLGEQYIIRETDLKVWQQEGKLNE